MRMHFLNKLPEYMLVIQLVQDRGSQLHFGLSSLYHSCEIQLWVLVVFLHHSELHRVAFQDDWIASRMKNSAKMNNFRRNFVKLRHTSYLKMDNFRRPFVKLSHTSFLKMNKFRRK